jgi:hypothetical protein
MVGTPRRRRPFIFERVLRSRPHDQRIRRELGVFAIDGGRIRIQDHRPLTTYFLCIEPATETVEREPLT